MAKSPFSTAVLLLACLVSPALAAPKDSAMTSLPPNSLYPSGRAPLAPTPFAKLPIGSIAPGGWLGSQLKMMADGLAGRLPELSRFCQFDGNAWVAADGQGKNGWEEVPYWLKGFADLGYLLHDPRINAEAQRWIEGVLHNQEASGYFGPRKNIQDKKPNETGPLVEHKLDLWPNMIMLTVLQHHYEATGDARILDCLRNYFRWQLNLPEQDILPGYWDKMRGGDNLASIYWLYDRTGDAWLLDAAARIHRCTARWDQGVVNWHGVNVAQGYREPAIWYRQSKDPRDLQAAERNYQTVRTLYGQVPGGLWGADENAREGYHDPRQAAETCTMTEMMNSLEMLMAITGDPVQADRCEDISFNSFPASHSPDLKSLHYLTAPNQVQLDRADKSPGIENSGDMFSYDPRRYRCCQHNASMGWPFYAEHLWMASPGNGLAAILYAPCTVRAKVANGVDLLIDQATDYPFSDQVKLTLTLPKNAAFPLMLRVPGWCQNASVAINGQPQNLEAKPGSFITLNRTWSTGDTLLLTLPMALHLTTWAANQNGVSVNYGPLTFSLRIKERWAPYWSDARGWHADEVFPQTPWNYGLELPADPSSALKVVHKGPAGLQPFASPDSSPIEIHAKGRRLPAWTTNPQGLVNPLPSSPVASSEPLEDLVLVPMGAARLRISVFPTIASDSAPAK